MAKSKIQRGYYPISYADLNRRIGYCENWGYGNKDTCKYVTETIIESIEMNHPELPIRESLYGDLMSIVDDLNSGANYKDQLLIPIKE